MPKEIFEYDNIEPAQKDLMLFSNMNAHEDKPLYLLVSDQNKYRIEHFIDATNFKQDTILLIAINGVWFKRQANIS